ncbi:MAG: thioredoxin family protein [Clostridiales bacterium]|nr:thioredoxin family protein [Clostridiales bacterium]
MLNKGKWMRAAVLVLVVVLVGGIWFIKNQGNADKKTAAVQNEQQGGELAAAGDPNFELYTNKMDVAALSAYQLPMLLDFGADDCIPCQQMAPALDAIHAEMQGKAIVKFVDVWKNTDGADGFPIQVVPTQIMIYADGTPYVPSEDMADSGIRFTMYSKKDTEEHMFTLHQGGLTQDQMRLILKDLGVV